ncbi:MAG: hypothetical protein KF866_10010 [Phycisphaeraceae bacterium]|nr:hypothetical protein [Phycisphaeraceae bacterium]MCW5754834.1 hypothetical protein [Phycisphaeraceae bacterium]
MLLAKPRIINAAGFTLAALIAAGVALLVWREQVQENRHRESRLNAAMSFESDLAKAEDRLQRHSALLQLAESKLSIEQSVLRPLTIRNEIIGQITRLAGDCGLAVDALTPRPPRTQPPIQVVDMSLTGRGEFPDLVRFIRRSRQLMPDVRVQALLVNGDASRATPDLAFKIDLAWHAADAGSNGTATPKSQP